MVAKITMEVIGGNANQVASLVLNGSADPHAALTKVVDLVAGGAAGEQPIYMRTMVDDSVGTSATGSAAVTYANIAAADKLIVGDSLQQVEFTCVSTVPVAGDNTFQKVTDATATGASLAAAINSSPQMKGRYTAAAVTGTVTLTVTAPGTRGNTSWLTKQMANGAGLTLVQFSGGRDAASRYINTITLGANPTNGQTLTIGAVVLTFVTSSANESQITIGADKETTAASLSVCINAHSKLKGLMSATNAATTALVPVTLNLSGRFGALVPISTNATITFTQASFAPATTETWVQNDNAFGVGLKAATT